MILYLSTHCRKSISRFFVTVFYLSIATASWGRNISSGNNNYSNYGIAGTKEKIAPTYGSTNNRLTAGNRPSSVKGLGTDQNSGQFSGGPTQPEMSTFKPVSADNLVNLFTGNFSYNIPLLDVGGYPVNIFYDGSISPDQEASWVGLGWNINPGAITRNMRGVPDDFDGTDILKQTQGMKPNKTWGVNLGADLEILGLKTEQVQALNTITTTTSSSGSSFSVGLSLGVTFNNYLGPAMDFGIKGGYSFSLGKKSGSEKSPFGMGVGLNINNSSRNGVSISPNVSFSGSLQSKDTRTSMGIGLSTSYNSRSGIRSLQIADQVSVSQTETKTSSTKFGGQTFNSVKETNVGSVGGMNMLGTSISFVKPSYIPAMRMPITNSAGSGHFQLGTSLFGAHVNFEAEVSSQKSEIADADKKQEKPLVGYLYYEKANGNPNAVMDFTRIGDKEVTPNTPIISAPQYTYDIFSISGEGTGGTIRPYRNDLGYVRDNLTRSKDKSISAGADIGIPSHYGVNFSIVKTPSTIGEWNGGNKLRNTTAFVGKSGSFENVYFRNPGESSVLQEGQFDDIGGTDLVRYVIGGNKQTPTIEPKLKRVDKTGSNLVMPADAELKNYNRNLHLTERKKRTQVINFLTAGDAATIALDKKIRSYSQGTLLDAVHNNILLYDSMLRYDETDAAYYRKKHHISQVNVTEADGRRYIYGIPVYNITQTDFTFSVDNPNNSRLDANNMVGYKQKDATENSDLLSESGNNLFDGYVQSTTTPAYAHSFLLSGLLSPDYVDVTGNGITEDDLGNAVKFNYSNIKNADGSSFKWRAPHTTAIADGGYNGKANFNPGNRSSSKDDKGLVVYGERESWYLHSLESKTMIAVFTLGNRYDGKGAGSADGGVNSGDNALKKLDKIDLYSKSDLRKNGIAGAKPIKTVHFKYSYKLCRGTIDNSPLNTGDVTNPNQGGKLTLERIYFTFNGQNRASKNQYVFGYGDMDANTADNPNYSYNASDRWGNYKKASEVNPGSPDRLNNSDYPYSAQVGNGVTQEKINQQAGAWCLKKVLLPSGGQIEVEYESDEYAFVQNKRAAVMTRIVGLTDDPANSPTNELYKSVFSSSPYSLFRENRYVVIDAGHICNRDSVAKFIDGQTQLAFRLAVEMPKGYEYLTAYGDIKDYGVMPSNSSQFWIELQPAGDDALSPLSLTAMEYLREQLPGQAYPAYDVSGQSTLKQVGNMLVGMLDGLTEIFQDQVKHLRSKGFARFVDLNASFVRLNQPYGYKMGGGNRVKSVIIRNNWNKMTEKTGVSGSSEAASVYGQQYDYSTTDVINGEQRTISSGVASYEPSIGGEENPFQTIMRIGNSIPMGPTSYGSIEMPFLDAFFPSPVVGYSKVTVRSIINNPDPTNKKTRSGIGKQVTEFYTAKDYPIKWSYTSLEPESVKEAHANVFAFFWKHAFDSKAMSQGFLVELNDMNGKMKSQASYPENDDKTAVNFTQNFYRNIGDKGLDEQFDFVSKSSKGAITKGNIGIDIELMTDAREFKVETKSFEVQGQVDIFTTVPPFPVPTIWPVFANSENTYRAVTCTKVINYHSVLDKVVVVDKGSMVSTENQVFDAETGQVIVNRTNNEFDKPIYSTTYPAYWAYSGMGLAYKNIDATFTNVDFLDGVIMDGSDGLTTKINTLFESGDEIYIKDGAAPSTGCASTLAALNAGQQDIIWAFDRDKNSTSINDKNISALTNTTPDFIFMDKQGVPFTRSGVTIRIVRSGKRNMLGAPVATVASMKSPIGYKTNGIDRELQINNTSKVINASATEYKEKWQTDNDVIQRKKFVYNAANCSLEEIIDCEGLADLEKKINPYVKGLLGIFRNWQGKVLYAKRANSETMNPATLPPTPNKTQIPEDGHVDEFSLYWNFNSSDNLVPDVTSSKWVWNSQLTRTNAKGMELETKDALGIYTGAQYGYDKTLPVAIGNNAKYNELAFEGFEDDNYAAAINPNNQANCAINRHFNFSSITGATIANNGTLGFNAHTGKNMLGIPAGTNIAAVNNTADFRIANRVDEFPLLLQSGIATYLNDPGINVTDIVSSPYAYGTNGIQIYTNGSGGGWFGIDVNTIQPRELPSVHDSQLGFKTSHYIEVTDQGFYNFSIEASQQTPMPPEFSAATSASIFDIDNHFVGEVYFNFNEHGIITTNGAKSICLKAGLYHIVSNVQTEIVIDHTASESQNYEFEFLYSIRIKKPVSPYDNLAQYKSTSTLNGCAYTKPIYGEISMLNPTFSLSQGKKMLFSSWVKENCPAPCSTYTQSGAELVFEDINGNPVDANGADPGNNVIISPSGNIIEGWQKVEKEFTVPAGAVKIKVALKNSGSVANYWDDIRIHPFNANMKSYVYDPINLRLTAELDANNYASFYEYDEEGSLIRTKAETKEGIKTIKETRSAKQKKITDLP